MSINEKFKLNNSGKALITYVLRLVIVILMFTFIVDFGLLFAQHMFMTYNANYLANKLMVQGGTIGIYDEKDFNSDQKISHQYAVTTNSEIISSTQNWFYRFGVTGDRFSIYVDDNMLYDKGKINKNLNTRDGKGGARRQIKFGDISNIEIKWQHRYLFAGPFFRYFKGSKTEHDLSEKVFSVKASFTSDYYNAIIEEKGV